MAEKFFTIFNALPPSLQREAVDFVVFLSERKGGLPDGTGAACTPDARDYITGGWQASDKDVDSARRMEALRNVQRMLKRLPDGFDPDKALAEALEEKHGRVD